MKNAEKEIAEREIVEKEIAEREIMKTVERVVANRLGILYALQRMSCGILSASANIYMTFLHVLADPSHKNLHLKPKSIPPPAIEHEALQGAGYYTD